jgi:hypothetical protein
MMHTCRNGALLVGKNIPKAQESQKVEKEEKLSFRIG